MEEKKRVELNPEQLNKVVGGITSSEKAKFKELAKACEAAQAAGDAELFESCKDEFTGYVEQLVAKYGLDDVALLFL